MQKPGKRIYIIDDDESVCRALERLVRTAGYRPVTVSNGNDFLNNTDIDMDALVVCDLFMPGMNGVEIYQTLQSRNIELPFIFITGADEDVVVDEAKRTGCPFFRKPIDGEQLLKVLSALN